MGARWVGAFAVFSTVAVAGCGDSNSVGNGGWNPPFSGRRAYIVSSDVTAPPAGAPQSFTLVFDGDQRIAIVGGNRTGSSTSVLASANGAFRFGSTTTIPLGFSGDCPGDSVRYDDLEFELDGAGRLTGTGRGELTLVTGDVAESHAATMSLTGVPDTQGPTVGLYTNGMLGDPFTPFTFASSEPLPTDALPVFRAENGDVVMPTSLPGDVFNIRFAPPALLPFDHSYTVDIQNIVDFAGNQPTADGVLQFSSGSLPLLVAPDGFESQTDMLISGTGAQFLPASSGFPIISGERGLFVPPEISSGPTLPATDFALRLAIAPGGTVLRFSYRTVSLPMSGESYEYLVGSVGSPLTRAKLPPASAPGTPMVLGGQPLTVGPIMTAMIELPDPTASEVVFARATRPGTCGHLLPPAAGVLIDDLRTE